MRENAIELKVGLLMIGAILFLLALGVGYYVRVVRPKYRGRPVNK